jgi:hypothetical protein
MFILYIYIHKRDYLSSFLIQLKNKVLHSRNSYFLSYVKKIELDLKKYKTKEYEHLRGGVYVSYMRYNTIMMMMFT